MSDRVAVSRYSLPSLTNPADVEDIFIPDSSTCPVCRRTWQTTNGTLNILCANRHVVCEACGNVWAARSDSCPLCRADAEVRVIARIPVPAEPDQPRTTCERCDEEIPCRCNVEEVISEREEEQQPLTNLQQLTQWGYEIEALLHMLRNGGALTPEMEQLLDILEAIYDNVRGTPLMSNFRILLSQLSFDGFLETERNLVLHMTSDHEDDDIIADPTWSPGDSHA